jgi:prepilin-type N-terminal cleavage/methylation domain-containing protein
MKFSWPPSQRNTLYGREYACAGADLKLMKEPFHCRAFVLLELVVVLAVSAALAAIAVPLYGNYMVRAQLAQLLVQIDQIATAVQTEDATGVRNLQRGARPGRSPPHLSTLPDSSFTEPGGIRLLLIRAPPGFFASEPQLFHYALVAEATGHDSAGRLAQLRDALPFGPDDKVWIGSRQLAFPLVAPITTPEKRSDAGLPADLPIGTRMAAQHSSVQQACLDCPGGRFG